MKLSQFEKGDVIHRTTATRRGDRSCIETPIVFLAVESGLLFYRDYTGVLSEYLHSLALDVWDDGNWEHFPEELWKKLSRKRAGGKRKKPSPAAKLSNFRRRR